MNSIIIVVFIILLVFLINRSKHSRKYRKRPASFDSNGDYLERVRTSPDNRTDWGNSTNTGNGANSMLQTNLIPSEQFLYQGQSAEDIHASPPRGLFELEQSTGCRGTTPLANQPNHTANLWKCDQSQMSTNACDSISNGYTSDIYTPCRGKMVNMGPSESSNMHITSRFASTDS
jgi:hypothetical protein